MKRADDYSIREWLLHKSLKQAGFLDEEIKELIKIDTDVYYKPFEDMLGQRRNFIRTSIRKGLTKKEIFSRILKYYKDTKCTPLEAVNGDIPPQYKLKLRR